MQIVKIQYYDPIKGKGVYLDHKYTMTPFRYTDFKGRMVETGSLARLEGTLISSHNRFDILKWGLLKALNFIIQNILGIKRR